MVDRSVELDFERLGDAGVNITHFSVDTKHRGTGIGSAVLTALLTHFRDQGIEYVVANSHGGEIARRFLVKHGFDFVEGPNVDGFVTCQLDLDNLNTTEEASLSN